MKKLEEEKKMKRDEKMRMLEKTMEQMANIIYKLNTDMKKMKER